MMTVEAGARMRELVEIGGIARGDEVGPQPVPYHQDDDAPARRRIGSRGCDVRGNQNAGEQDADKGTQSGR